MHITAKEMFLRTIKENVEHWNWVEMKQRRHEVAYVRLRMGHVRLRGHMIRFNLADDASCEACNVEETVEHYMMYCQRYTLAWQKL